MTTILLIRHGQTDWNLTGRWQGHTDIPLNETGIAQARLLADRLANWPIKAIYSSDLSRASQTANIVASKLDLKPEYSESLRERNGGIFQGLTTVQIRNEYPEEFAGLQESGTAPLSGESNLDVARRLKKKYDQIVNDHQGQMVAVVSHGGALSTIVAYLLGFPLGQKARISLRANTGLSIVEVGHTGPVLTLMNDVNHLRDTGLSNGAGFSFGTDGLDRNNSE